MGKGNDIHTAVLELIDKMAEEGDMCKSCACSNLAAFLIVDGTMRRCGEGDVELAGDSEEVTQNFMQVMPFVLNKATDILNEILGDEGPTVH